MSGTATTGPEVHGILAESKPDMIVLALPGTDYRLHLAVNKPLQATLTKPLTGTIRAHAKRVDVMASGGRFIEPVYGRPRRVQGRISEINAKANTITVMAAAPFVCALMPGQQASSFEINQLVGFDVERGASFELIEATHGKNLGSHLADTTPAGHRPTEGPQGKEPAGKTTDHGALSIERGVEGQLKPSGEQPLTDTGRGNK